MKQPTIEVAKVPRPVRDDLARTILENVVAFFDQPGVEEDFQAWLKEYKARKAATSMAAT